MKFIFKYSIYRASVHAYEFVSKGDGWGRMFGYVEWIPKVFPKFSEFELLRNTAMKFYDWVKVTISSISLLIIMFQCEFSTSGNS